MRKTAIWTTALCCVMGFSLAACVPDVKENSNVEATEAPVSQEYAVSDGSSLQDVYDSIQNQATQYAPEVKTLEDGTQIQLTPDSSEDAVFYGAPSSFNTYYLNSDNRGCISCHESGLQDLTQKMNYKHYSLDNGLGTNIDVKDCRLCHNESSWMIHGITKSFGNLIHGIHSKDSFKGDCMSCHAATSDGAELQLWEDARYDVLSGILPVSDVQGDFSYEQDVIGGNLGMTWWPMTTTDEGVDKAFQNAELDPEVPEQWEISVSGMVDNPFTITLKELIESAPSETFISSAQCILNPPSGEFVANVEVTGVPVSWLLEKASVKDTATTITNIGSDGYEWQSLIADVEHESGWIIYEVNGEPLSYLEGYPCRIWYPEHAIPMSTRWISELVIDDSDVEPLEGFGIDGVPGGTGSWIGGEDETIEFLNKPNVAVCNTHEGEIIPTGEKYEFEGYAQAFNEQVVAVEFSMDRGETWTRFDTSDSDKLKWVYWHFGFTPEEKGSYVLSVRAITETGRVSPVVDEVMFNAK